MIPDIMMNEGVENTALHFDFRWTVIPTLEKHCGSLTGTTYTHLQ